MTDLKSALKELVQAQKDTEYLDLSEQSITSIEGDLMPYICQFTNLKEVNLEDNLLSKLPDNMSQIFRNVVILNLNGNEFIDFQHTIRALQTVPNLKSLFLNLHEEDQVDLVMRTLPTLQELNSLPVERDLIQSSGSEDLNNDPQRIDEEENEDEDTHNSSVVMKKAEDLARADGDRQQIMEELEQLKEAEKEIFESKDDEDRPQVSPDLPKQESLD